MVTTARKSAVKEGIQRRSEMQANFLLLFKTLDFFLRFPTIFLHSKKVFLKSPGQIVVIWALSGLAENN